ncbi:HNH endonuclease signature motif containing protein [Pseudaquabacterium pictum]|uniref:HNH endonuclease signature motif containing protein n=1 Tax=Pseudaquabacterium pictum TaxID=2315236 RepID=UPI0010F9422F|nr:HNH endonuclease signature motif containing protein [Rubrivivax pictus]
MSDANKHGLSRTIPANVKRLVRQACGFGCVVCGSALIEYEHVDPPFAWATSHDPECIALLCPQCHAKVTRRFLNKGAVAAAMKAPFCLRQGFSSEVFAMGASQPRIAIGGVLAVGCVIPLLVKGIPVLKIEPSDAPGGPVRLSGQFHNAQGDISLQIEENEWRPLASNWDVDVSGGAITIRDAPGHISLRLRLELPDLMVVEAMDMLAADVRVVASRDTLDLFWANGSHSNLRGCVMSNCHVGVAIS